MIIDRMRYIYHLDSIKAKKKMTTKHLCQNICSERQYRKYLSGDNNISDSRITEFCNVLGISSRDFYYTLNKDDIYEYGLVREIYELLMNKEYSKVSTKLDAIKDPDSFSFQNNRFLNYCIIRLKFEKKSQYPDATVLDIKELLDYSQIKNSDIFDFVDILLLRLLAEIEVTIKKTECLDLLIRILSNRELIYLSAETRNMMPVVYSTVSVLLGRLKRFEECIEVSNAGIEYCNKFSFSKTLTWLFYSKSIANKMLHNHIDAELNAVYCFTNVIAGNNKKDIKIFYNLLKDDFQKDPFQLIQDYKSTILELD